MKILVNGESHEIDGGWENVPALVRSFYESGRFAGEMIVDLKVDGQSVPLDDDSEHDADGVDTLEVTTVSSEAAFADAARSIGERLGLLLDVLQQVVGAFREGSDDAAHAAFSETVGHMHNILIEAREIDDAKETVLRLETDDSVSYADPGALVATFTEIVGAQEQRDSVLVADLLEFELLPVLQEPSSS